MELEGIIWRTAAEECLKTVERGGENDEQRYRRRMTAVL